MKKSGKEIEEYKEYVEEDKKEKCYFCKKEFNEDDRGSFYVIIEGKSVRAHKDCYKKWQAAGKTNVRVVVR